jgi:iron complex outermembrane receptor protein
VFDRAGNAIPGVPKQTLNLRAGYDIQSGALRGIGAFIETSWRESAFADNANLMRAPGYTLLNLNAHYDPPEGMGALSRVRFYISARNLADRRTKWACDIAECDRIDLCRPTAHHHRRREGETMSAAVTTP